MVLLHVSTEGRMLDDGDSKNENTWSFESFALFLAGPNDPDIAWIRLFPP